MRLYRALPLFAVLLGCSAAGSAGGDKPLGPLGGGGKADQPNNLPLALDTVDSVELFDKLAFSDGGGLTIGRSVKFLIDHRNPANPTIHFMNANFVDGQGKTPESAKFHFFLAEAILPGFSETIATFDERTYFDRDDKRYFAGTVQRYQIGDGDPLYGIQFYPQDVIAEEQVLTAAEVVKGAFVIPGANLGFVATGPQQTTEQVAPQLLAAGIDNLTIDEILGALTFIPMQLGEALGFLRVFPPDNDELSALDIPVFAELPLDLTVVAGTISVQFQDASSHINLKSKERGTPNMVLRDAGPSHPVLSEFADKPVRLVVRSDGFDIFPATEKQVVDALAERLNKPWVPMGVVSAPVSSFRDMCPLSPSQCLESASRYGGKSSGMGFLMHRRVLGRATDSASTSSRHGRDLAPAGVAVPLTFYEQFIRHPANRQLKIALDALIADEKAGLLSPRQRADRLSEVRQLMLDGTFPQDVLPAVREHVVKALPDARSVKVRSSANAEDVPGFDGAGLYNSYRADLDEIDEVDGHCEIEVRENDSNRVRPRSLACAIKGSYASLWNKRAVEERTFARLDHETAAMGCSIVQRYSERGEIEANSVVVTRVIGSNGVSGYTFSSQKDNNTVTNPGAGSFSENVIAAFSVPGVDPAYVVTRFAKPNADGPQLTETVLTEPQMGDLLDIVQSVERAYCQFKVGYYSGPCENALVDRDKPRSLDLEFKMYEDGGLWCKQVREFSGR